MELNSLLLLLSFNSILVVALSNAFMSDGLWNMWKRRHGKTYSDVNEEALRYEIWLTNYRYVQESNRKNNKVKLSMNQFADLTNIEVRFLVNGYLHTNSKKDGGALFLQPNYVNVPDTVDWRNEGYVTPVKDQRLCGSCWAFSTTGSLEGQHFKATKKLVSLSEQQLIECSWSYGNHGCQGGLMTNAFKYLIDSEGEDTEQGYPYTALESPFCEFNPSFVGATMSNYVKLPRGDEEALKQAVATVGPISVAIDASQTSFHLYKSGIYDEPNCNSAILDHGVLVVGYGSDNGQDYWLVKNSWNTTWGMEGYIKMSRNKNNQCGIASQASYPVV